jgi:hypothetical protein
VATAAVTHVDVPRVAHHSARGTCSTHQTARTRFAGPAQRRRGAVRSPLPALGPGGRPGDLRSVHSAAEGRQPLAGAAMSNFKGHA